MKKTITTCLVIVLSILALSSCSTDKSMIARGVDLKKYELASIVQTKNAAESLNDIEIEPGIYEAIENTRLRMVGERRVNELTQDEKEKLVLVKYAATSNPTESTISVTFEDFMTGKTVASCRSSHHSAFTCERDVKRTIRKVAGRIKKMWQ